ncbi:MAG: cyclic-di-AMP receptor [Clostridium sp.]|uniref:cyclic-di-AMP receptor n=1 Tax=Clostridium sp. TaxID=1506 RepID=UPI003F3464F2
MKLVITIVSDDDSELLMDKLTENEFRVTKLATTGGFLKSGNTTLLIGVAKSEIDRVMGIIKDTCKKREEIMVTPAPIIDSTEIYTPYPINVTVGGATIFVVDVDQFIQM